MALCIGWFSFGARPGRMLNEKENIDGAEDVGHTSL